VHHHADDAEEGQAGEAVLGAEGGAGHGVGLLVLLVGAECFAGLVVAPDAEGEEADDEDDHAPGDDGDPEGDVLVALDGGHLHGGRGRGSAEALAPGVKDG